jgi:hypothetical protein
VAFPRVSEVHDATVAEPRDEDAGSAADSVAGQGAVVALYQCGERGPCRLIEGTSGSARQR